MNCPKCKEKLKEINLGKIKIDHCDHCGGMWFDKDELEIAYDYRDENLGWFDFDLWKDEKKFIFKGRSSNCPHDGKPLFKIKYGDTNVMVDVCLDCQGIWLDKNELESIISSMKEKINVETAPEYIRDLLKETKELITHPGRADIELKHIMILMKLLKYRVVAKHPEIIEITSVMPH